MREMTRAVFLCAAVAIAPAPAVGVRMPPGVGPSVRRAPPRSMAVAAPPELSRAEQKERRVKTGQHLKRLAFLSSDPPPDACAVGMRELETMGAEGLAVNVNAHNQAMCLCSGEPAVVERLFGELEARQIENEGSYAALARALTEAGELAKASAAVTRLLRAPHSASERAAALQPKLRTAAPLLRALCASDERGAAVRLWRQLERSGVGFGEAEYAAMLGMLARAGARRQLRRRLDDYVDMWPRPTAEGAALVADAFGGLAGTPAAAHARLRRGAPDAAALRLLSLSDDQLAHVRRVLLDRAQQTDSASAVPLLEFAAWLDGRPPFDYVIDGPNVAYYNQNFEGGAFSYRQIAAVMAHLQAGGRRVLLLLPEKYVQEEVPNHTCSSERRNKVAAADLEMLERLRAEGTLYEVPRRVYDDWFWMYASVAAPPAGGGGGGGGGAVAAPRALTRVVSNDAMRDHWVELLPRRFFDRWRAAQILGFSVGAAGGGDGGGDGEQAHEVSIAEPPPYSVEAQRSGDTWHVPVPGAEGEEPSEWLRITVDPPMFGRVARWAEGWQARVAEWLA